MPKERFALALKSADCGLEACKLIYVADLIRAITLIYTSAPGLTRKQVTTWLSILRSSVIAICHCVGETKTVDDTLISEIVDIEDRLNASLTDLSAVMRSRCITQLRLLLAFARSIGYKHETFGVQDDWEHLAFLAMDSCAQVLINDLMRRKVRPRQVSHAHLDDWKNRDNRGHPFRAQTISQFKFRIRQSDLEASFPLLDVNPVRASLYSVPVAEMNLNVQRQLGEIVDWLKNQHEREILRMDERTRLGFIRDMERLYGVCVHYLDVPDIDRLELIFTQQVITDCARCLYFERQWKPGSISTFLHSLHSVLKVHPWFEGQKWSWMLDLITEFPEEPESAIEGRRRERAFEYDHDALATIPGMIRAERESTPGLSRKEIGLSLHDELLILWLVTYPWPPRCLKECRISGTELPNLFKPSELTHRQRKAIERLAIGESQWDQWFFYFAPQEVPKRRFVYGALPQRLVGLLDLYWKYRCDLVRGENVTTLFLNRRGEPLSSLRLFLHVGNITEKYLGVRVPPNAFRDAFAYHWIDRYRDDESRYSTLASIRWESRHGVRFRFDLEYRAAVLAKKGSPKRH